MRVEFLPILCIYWSAKDTCIQRKRRKLMTYDYICFNIHFDSVHWMKSIVKTWYKLVNWARWHKFFKNVKQKCRFLKIRLINCLQVLNYCTISNNTASCPLRFFTVYLLCGSSVGKFSHGESYHCFEEIFLICIPGILKEKT